MATEDIKIRNGHICVDRVDGKQNVEVATSDVDTVSYTRGVWGGPGALVLHTKKGDVVIRVEAEDAGKVLKRMKTALDSEQTSNTMPAANEAAPDSNEDVDPKVESAAQKRK